MVVLKILGLLIWLLIVPYCMGLLVLPLLKEEQRTNGTALLAGYILAFTLLEVVGIPVVLLAVYNGLTTFCMHYAPLSLLLAGAGVFLTIRVRKKGYGWSPAESFQSSTSSRKQRGMEEKVMTVLFLALVGFQMYMAFTRASFDGDDAYYGVQALIAQQVDTLYRVNPYTGRSSPLDVRHALALFPIWEAYVGSMSGIHATIICHSVMPLVLIPLMYLLYYQIGKALLREQERQLPMFMTLLALWQMFGNISVYTTETFFLTRTWQGKSFAGNFVIPAVIWIFLRLFEKRENTGTNDKNTGLWLLLGALNLAGGASSSLAILLSCLMTVGFGFLFAVRERKLSILVKSGLSCVGGGVYVILYILLTHGIIGA